MAAMASALVMLPFGPVAGMALGSRLFSATTRCTAGDRCGSSPFTWADPALAGAAAAGAAAAAAPEAAMEPICRPGVTVAPVSAVMVSTPAAGAETSTATLSVSISTSSSSLATVSPDFFSQAPMEPSATLSPMVGTLMATASPAGAGAVFGASDFGASAFDAAGAAPAEAPSLTTPSTAPGVTVSPSAALISASTPSAGETTSSETLSV